MLRTQVINAEFIKNAEQIYNENQLLVHTINEQSETISKLTAIVSEINAELAEREQDDFNAFNSVLINDTPVEETHNCCIIL